MLLQVWQHFFGLSLVRAVLHRVLPAGEEGRHCVAGVLSLHPFCGGLTLTLQWNN